MEFTRHAIHMIHAHVHHGMENWLRDIYIQYIHVHEHWFPRTAKLSIQPLLIHMDINYTV